MVGSSSGDPGMGVSGALRGRPGEEKPPHGCGQQNAPTPQEEPPDTLYVPGMHNKQMPPSWETLRVFYPGGSEAPSISDP